MALVMGKGSKRGLRSYQTISFKKHGTISFLEGYTHASTQMHKDKTKVILEKKKYKD